MLKEKKVVGFKNFIAKLNCYHIVKLDFFCNEILCKVNKNCKFTVMFLFSFFFILLFILTIINFSTLIFRHTLLRCVCSLHENYVTHQQKKKNSPTDLFIWEKENETFFYVTQLNDVYINTRDHRKYHFSRIENYIQFACLLPMLEFVINNKSIMLLLYALHWLKFRHVKNLTKKETTTQIHKSK